VKPSLLVVGIIGIGLAVACGGKQSTTTPVATSQSSTYNRSGYDEWNMIRRVVNGPIGLRRSAYNPSGYDEWNMIRRAINNARGGK
jgi:hypothetical protein